MSLKKTSQSLVSKVIPVLLVFALLSSYLYFFTDFFQKEQVNAGSGNVSYAWTGAILSGSDIYTKGLDHNNYSRYVAGYTDPASIDFDMTNGIDNYTSTYGSYFISSYDNNDNYRWTTTLDQSNTNSLDLESLVATDNGFIIGGEFDGFVNFNSTGSGTTDEDIRHSAARDAYISSYIDDGNGGLTYNWTLTFGNSFKDEEGDETLQYATVRDLDYENVSGTSAIFAVGEFQGTMLLNPKARRKTSSGSEYNLALYANASCSSEWQPGWCRNVKDQLINNTCNTNEWATRREGEAGTVTLTWDKPVFIDGVKLFDRACVEDVTSGTLSFNGIDETYPDLSFGAISEPDSNGDGGTLINFSPRWVDSITINIDSAANISEGYNNAGFAEIEVLSVQRYEDIPEQVDQIIQTSPYDGIYQLSSQFIKRYSADGKVEWVKTIEQPDLNNSSDIQNVKANDSNIFISGSLNGTVDMDPSTSTDLKTSVGSRPDIFITKLTTNGDYVWTKVISGEYSSTPEIDLDDNGNIYLFGDFWGEFNSVSANGEGDRDIYIAKLNGTSGEIEWSHTIGNTNSEVHGGIEVVNDQIYINGRMTSPSVDFDPSAETDTKYKVGTTSFFVSNFQTDGSYGWTKVVGGNSSNTANYIDGAEGLSSGTGSLYSVGTFRSTVDFDFSAGYDYETAPNDNIFLTKYEAGNAYQIRNLDPDLEVVERHTNTDVEAQGINDDNAELRVRDEVTGRLIADVEVDMTNDRDWGGATAVDGDTDTGTAKSVVANLANADGAKGSHTLYIPKSVGHNTVKICPEAEILADVTDSCNNGYDLTQAAPNVSIARINGENYWKVEGLTGTGGLGKFESGVGFRLTPNSSPASTTQEVLHEYTTTDPATIAFSVGDAITFTWQDFPGLVLSECSTPTTDADNDGVADRDAVNTGVNIGGSGNNVFTYTFSGNAADATHKDIAICINVTSYSNTGNYTVTLNDDNAQYSQAFYYVADDNDVMIRGLVEPTLSLELVKPEDDGNLLDTVSGGTEGPWLCDLDTLTTSAVNECSYRLKVSTNASQGYTVFVQSDGNLRSGTNDIDDVQDGQVVNSNSEEYGIDLEPGYRTLDKSTTTGPELSRGGNFVAGNTGIGQFDAAAVPLYSAQGPNDPPATHIGTEENRYTGLVTHRAAISADTGAGHYTHMVSYTVVPTF